MIEPRRDRDQTTLREYALLAPRAAKLVIRLLRDPRVPTRNKATLLFVAGYLLSPVDVIPDFIPRVGQLDDIVIAALALNQLLNDVPEDVVRRHWDGDEDVLELIREVLRMSTAMVPAAVKKLFSSR
ncbi:hypothetical protein BH24ACT26_BH24ACT26_01820 [soil metagenome]